MDDCPNPFEQAGLSQQLNPAPTPLDMVESIVKNFQGSSYVQIFFDQDMFQESTPEMEDFTIRQTGSPLEIVQVTWANARELNIFTAEIYEESEIRIDYTPGLNLIMDSSEENAQTGFINRLAS